MAKPIYVPDEEVDAIVAQIKSQLLGQKCYGGIDIKRTFKKDDRAAIIYFTPLAWCKLKGLVSEYTTEVQWHGLVYRISENEFCVRDILVPPHTVSAATVVSDSAKYTEWINSLDDETFSAIRFHGHSHVNMGTSPSGVDDKYRQDLVTQLPKPTAQTDEFYIFMIFNKKAEWTGEIYDLTNNALYETADIDIDVMLDDGSFLSDFISEAKKVAVADTPKVTGYSGGYSAGYAGYSGWVGGRDSGFVSKANSTPPPDTSKSKGKGKKKKSDDTTDYYGNLGYQSYDYDDEEDPKSPFFAKGY